MVFAIVYGFFAGGFSSTWPGVQKEVARDGEGVDTAMVMGLLLGGRGIGNTVSGPISGALLNGAWAGSGSGSGSGYGSMYGPVIIYVGLTAFFGGWAGIWKNARRLSSLWLQT